MSVLTPKENILNRIREALSNPVPLPFPESEGTDNIFTTSNEDLTVIFAEEFVKLQGNFSYYAEENELAQQLKQLFSEKDWNKIYCAEDKLQHLLTANDIPSYNDLSLCDVSLTSCEYLVARTGSIVLSSAPEMGRTASAYAPVHICIAYTDQVVYDVKDALLLLQEKYVTSLPSFISFASGPSRTADIEKTLVTGVHGPKEVYCFLTDRNKI